MRTPSILIYDRANGLLFSSDIYAVNRYWVADNTGATGVKQDLLLSLHQQLMDIYTKDGAQVKELYTGHNRIGMGGDYLTMWEQCLQKFCQLRRRRTDRQPQRRRYTDVSGRQRV